MDFNGMSAGAGSLPRMQGLGGAPFSSANIGAMHAAQLAQLAQQAAFYSPHMQQHAGQLQQQQAPQLHRGAAAAAAHGDLHRLKVCGVPAGDFTDARLRQLFELCGKVVEARIVYDRDSGQAAGYAYVSYSSKAEADLAIATFDGQVQLAPGGDLLSVYYAKRQQDSAALGAREGPGRNAKLYFTGVPPGVPREAILKLFSQHGRVRHLQLYADELGALSSGTVTMFSRSEAAGAMAALDGYGLVPGVAPLKVAWAQLNVAPKAQQAELPGAVVAFSSLPPAVTPHEVAALFQRFGPVLKVIPFPARRDGPPGTRGCGRVIMAHPAHADAAVASLSGRFVWPGAEWPFLAQPFAGPAPSGFGAGPPWGGLAGFDAAGDLGGGAMGGVGGAMGGPPPGCEPDAYALVLANLPPLASEPELRQLLAAYGPVAALELAPAGGGGAPGGGGGGSATVWYASRAAADLARASLHGAALRSAGERGPRQLAVHAAPPGGGGAGALAAALGGGGGGGGGLLGRAAGAGLGGGGGLLGAAQQRQHAGLAAAGWGGGPAAALHGAAVQDYLSSLLLDPSGALAAQQAPQEPPQEPPQPPPQMQDPPAQGSPAGARGLPPAPAGAPPHARAAAAADAAASLGAASSFGLASTLSGGLGSFAAAAPSSFSNAACSSGEATPLSRSAPGAAAAPGLASGVSEGNTAATPSASGSLQSSPRLLQSLLGAGPGGGAPRPPFAPAAPAPGLWPATAGARRLPAPAPPGACYLLVARSNPIYAATHNGLR
ncbi:MAG: hypothetical protein J3K34DRAFT_455294 [Monoraphidium minutum]|nr:MAG: hypothetical protein J3K34DRAFT_455294 [Monoraphidium minutum]